MIQRELERVTHCGIAKGGRAAVGTRQLVAVEDLGQLLQGERDRTPAPTGLVIGYALA
jgi:hypothetical protein